MLYLAIVTTLCMLLIETLLYLDNKDQRKKVTLEFWLAYALYFAFSVLTQKSHPYIVALSSLTWIWRIRTIRLILEQVARDGLKSWWQNYLWAASFGLSILLALAGQSFTIVTIPPAIASFILGINYLSHCWRKMRLRRTSVTHYFLMTNVFIIFLHILDYPFLRYQHELTSVGFTIVLLTTLIMAIILPMVNTSEIRDHQRQVLDNLVRQRSQQAGYQSEFFAKGETIASIAHEINNPLGIILGRAGQIKKLARGQELDQEAMAKGLMQIRLSGERILKIVAGLSNQPSERPSEELESIALNRIIDETLVYCGERFAASGVKLTSDEYPQLKLECRPVQISQILLNLLNNSLDAVKMDSGSWVHLGIKVKDAMLEIRVSDSGKKIPASVEKKLMEPFFTTKEHGKGTGLGLSLSQKMAFQHGGKLFYQSKAPHTTFVLELPLQTIRHNRNS